MKIPRNLFFVRGFTTRPQGTPKTRRPLGTLESNMKIHWILALALSLTLGAGTLAAQEGEQPNGPQRERKEQHQDRHKRIHELVKNLQEKLVELKKRQAEGGEHAEEIAKRIEAIEAKLKEIRAKLAEHREKHGERKEGKKA